jgi:hypothetical protein
VGGFRYVCGQPGVTSHSRYTSPYIYLPIPELTKYAKGFEGTQVLGVFLSAWSARLLVSTYLSIRYLVSVCVDCP